MCFCLRVGNEPKDVDHGERSRQIVDERTFDRVFQTGQDLQSERTERDSFAASESDRKWSAIDSFEAGENQKNQWFENGESNIDKKLKDRIYEASVQMSEPEDREDRLSAVPRFPTDSEQSWLVSDQEVPEIKGIDVPKTRNLLLTNFQTNYIFVRNWIENSNQQNLYARDYATLATAVHNCELYLSLDTVFLALQISPGGLLRVDSEVQREHFKALIENIVEKFEPRHVVILSPIIPEGFDNFVGQSLEQVIEDSQVVINVIQDFCQENKTMGKSQIVHYALNEVFKVQGKVCQSLFFDLMNNYKLSRFGYSMLGSVISMIARSLNPKEGDSDKRLTLNDYKTNSYQTRSNYYHSNEPRNYSSVGVKGYRGYNFDRRDNYPRNQRRANNNQYTSYRSVDVNSNQYETNASYSKKGKGIDFSLRSDNQQSVQGQQKYGSYTDEVSERANLPRYKTTGARNSRYASEFQEMNTVDPYYEGYKIQFRKPDGTRSGFTGKFNIGFGNEKVKPPRNYKLKDNFDGYKFENKIDETQKQNSDDDWQ